MNHYEAAILFTDNRGRSMEVFIYFDESKTIQEDALKERVI